MIIDYIDRLRKESPEVRKTYAMFFTIGVTTVIVIVYLTILFIGNVSTQSNEDSQKTVAEKTTSDLFKTSNTFIENNEGGVSANSENDWTQELRQFNDDALLEPQTQKAFVGSTSPIFGDN